MMSASWQTIKEESWNLSSCVACMADVSAEPLFKILLADAFSFSRIPGPFLKIRKTFKKGCSVVSVLQLSGFWKATVNMFLPLLTHGPLVDHAVLSHVVNTGFTSGIY